MSDFKGTLRDFSPTSPREVPRPGERPPPGRPAYRPRPGTRPTGPLRPVPKVVPAPGSAPLSGVRVGGVLFARVLGTLGLMFIPTAANSREDLILVRNFGMTLRSPSFPTIQLWQDGFSMRIPAEFEHVARDFERGRWRLEPASPRYDPYTPQTAPALRPGGRTLRTLGNLSGSYSEAYREAAAALRPRNPADRERDYWDYVTHVYQPDPLPPIQPSYVGAPGIPPIAPYLGHFQRIEFVPYTMPSGHTGFRTEIVTDWAGYNAAERYYQQDLARWQADQWAWQDYGRELKRYEDATVEYELELAARHLQQQRGAVQSVVLDLNKVPVGSPMRKRRKPRDDRKTRGKAYRQALSIINKTWGNYEEGMDVVIAFLENIESKSMGNHSWKQWNMRRDAQGDLYFTPASLKVAIGALEAGTATFNWGGFLQDIAWNQFEDRVFGEIGKRSARMHQEDMRGFQQSGLGFTAGPGL
jgi:hypothetical protein